MILILASFEITFLITRIVTHLLKLSDSGGGGIAIGGLHIHHLVFGIILLLVSGLLGIGFPTVQKINKFASVLFGIGAALTLDEFALWLNLQDVYWARQGRESIDAVIVFSALVSIIVLVNLGRRVSKWDRLLHPFG